MNSLTPTDRSHAHRKNGGYSVAVFGEESSRDWRFTLRGAHKNHWTMRPTDDIAIINVDSQPRLRSQP